MAGAGLYLLNEREESNRKGRERKIPHDFAVLTSPAPNGRAGWIVTLGGDG
jgi:hypothetical protein